MVEEFGKFSADSNEINVRDNARAFMARITHEQAMRYDMITFLKAIRLIFLEQITI